MGAGEIRLSIKLLSFCLVHPRRTRVKQPALADSQQSAHGDVFQQLKKEEEEESDNLFS